jgi:hypothetical protein
MDALGHEFAPGAFQESSRSGRLSVLRVIRGGGRVPPTAGRRIPRRLYTLDHVHERASGARHSLATGSISVSHGLLSRIALPSRLRIRTSGMIVTAIAAAPREKRKCTIVAPTFNESKSFPTLMDALFEKQLPRD